MDLPLEVWQLIFGQFDTKSLKNVLLWSETFRELVIKTPALMRKLPVIFHGNSWEEKISFVEKHGKCVSSVKFIKCIFEDFNEIRKILKMIPNVEEIVCVDVYTENVAAVENNDFLLKLQKVEITKLENLIHPEFSESFLKLLKNSTNLKNFKIRVYEYSNCDYLGDFLTKQDKLECLTADGNLGNFTLIEAISTENLLKNSKFRLKSLTIRMSQDYNEKCSRFLMKHSKTIEELAINFYDMNFHYFRLLLNNFHNIRKLTICIGSLLNDTRVEEIRKMKMPSVTELKFVNHCNEGALFKILFDIFPNVEVLTTEVYEPPLRVALEKLPKLRKLHSSSNYTHIHFIAFAKSESLTELILENVSQIMAPIFVLKMAEDLPNLEKLVIKNLDVGNLFITVQEDVKIILESLKFFKKLKSFELVNTESKKIYVNPDIDLVEGEEDGQEAATFRLVIETEEGQKKLKASEYFSRFQSEVLEKLKIDLKIVESV